MTAVKNFQYLLKLLRTNSELPKEVKSIANLVREVTTPKTKGVGYFIPHKSQLSVREQLGLSKGAYGSLNKFQKQALEDWNNQIYPGTVSINDRGMIQFLQPFAFYMRKGGPLINIRENG